MVIRPEDPKLNDGTPTRWLGCYHCRHLRQTASGERPAPYCAAFEQGIPGPIQAGMVDHLVPRPELGQDNEIVYEEVPDLDEWLEAGAPEERRDPNPEHGDT